MGFTFGRRGLCDPVTIFCRQVRITWALVGLTAARKSFSQSDSRSIDHESRVHRNPAVHRVEGGSQNEVQEDKNHRCGVCIALYRRERGQRRNGNYAEAGN